MVLLRRNLLMLFLLALSPGDNLFSSETVNPHWSGKHCVECHLATHPGENSAHLRSDGNIVELCNRCHNGELATSETHPFAVALPDYMEQFIPSGWPLQEQKITCLTCHNARIQMSENPLAQLVQSSFVRQPFSRSPDKFCFSCHQRNDYQRVNPHRQIDPSGTVREERCLMCHQSVPDRKETSDPATITLRGEQTNLCISCHGGKDTNHPTRGTHLELMPDSMKEAFTRQCTDRGVCLPLESNTITCVTCHNPHQKGVLLRREAAAGAGAPYFLRIRRGRELCTTCHTDLKLPKQPGRREAFSPPRPERTIEHKPVGEKKCKACHAINGYTDFKRETLYLCFQKGCHETTLLDNTSVHEAVVLGSCTFCHNPHSSGYDHLLFNTEDRLCSVCHPLLRDTNGKMRQVNHQQLLSGTAAFPLPAENECSFCHNTSHYREIDVISTDLCADCHRYLREQISQNAHRATDQTCSACHEPHTSPHPYQLKEPPETYTW